MVNMWLCWIISIPDRIQIWSLCFRLSTLRLLYRNLGNFPIRQELRSLFSLPIIIPLVIIAVDWLIIVILSVLLSPSCSSLLSLPNSLYGCPLSISSRWYLHYSSSQYLCHLTQSTLSLRPNYLSSASYPTCSLMPTPKLNTIRLSQVHCLHSLVISVS